MVNVFRVRFPPPPLCKSLKDKELPEQPSGMAASGQRRPDTAGPSMAPFGAISAGQKDLSTGPAIALIAEMWPQLPCHIRTAILTLVAGSTSYSLD
jgi:hypothetical protein